MSSVILEHFGRNKMPLGRDTRVVSDNIVLDQGPSHGKKRLGGQNPHFAAMLPTVK